MKLTTPVNIKPNGAPFELGASFFCLGSCFAERVADRLTHHLFPTVSNPYGIVYNPVSLAQALRADFQPGDLLLHERSWRSLETHTSLASSSRKRALDNIRRASNRTQEALKSSQRLILTLGTALVFQSVNTGQIVANCHRLPQKHFLRRRLSVEETVTALRPGLDAWLAANPERQVVLTVSPVRHLKDGAVENNRSKAVLLLACDQLVEMHQRIHYFPAYEILMDELRSYRFYKDDMIHPTDQSVEIVWRRFLKAHLDPSESQAFELLTKVLEARRHQLGERSETHKFSKSALSKLERLEALSPGLNLEHLRQYFSRLGEPSTPRG